uniref:Putative ovule protein n=1 Tax=Solanum chacoense TaxID=4108 RepID=A0A0V0HQQ0_SOLCH
MTLKLLNRQNHITSTKSFKLVLASHTNYSSNIYMLFAAKMKKIKTSRKKSVKKGQKDGKNSVFWHSTFISSPP